MATYNTTIGTGLFLRVTTTVNSTNIANNTKNVTTTASLITTSGNVNASTSKAGTLTVDGTSYSFSKVIGSLGKNSSLELYSVTKDIKHNADGTKNLSVSCSFAINITYSGVYKGTITAGGTEILPTIPRTSKVTCNSFYVGDSTTINIERYSSSFTHTLTYSFGNATGTIATKTTSTSVGWSPTASTLYAQMTNLTGRVGTITCTTYNGNTVVGTSTCTFTAYTLESRCTPTISAAIVDTNSVSVALTGNSSIIVKNLSKPKVTITDAAKNNASISARYIGCGDGQYSTAKEHTFSNGIANSSISVYTTDSRGYGASQTYNLSSLSRWVEYVPIALSLVSITRPESTANTLNLKIRGNYFNGSFGSVTNSFTVKYRYKINDGDWTSYTTVTPTKTNDTFDYSTTLSGMSYQNKYTFEVVAEDKAAKVTSGDVIVSKGKGNITIGADYVRVNVDLKDSSGTKILNGLSVYEGGNLDPDTSIEELILTQTKTPSSGFWYIKTMFYSKKSTTSNRTQLAYPYSQNMPSYYRYYFNGAWSEWKVLGAPIVTSSPDTGAAIDGELSIEWGKVVVTPVANTPTNVSIIFNKTYAEAPIVLPIPSTGVIGSGVIGTSTVATSTTGATLAVYRVNTVPTGIHFLIIGKLA